MSALPRLSIGHPRAALTFWTAVAVVLALIGLGAERSLSPSITVAPGTESSRAEQLANGAFGPSVLVPILLIGIAVAVILDALVVRPVLLPAAVAVLGRRSWWPTRVLHPTAAPSVPPPSQGGNT